MKFLLQQVNGEVVFDLVFAVRQNIFYQIWRGEDVTFKYAEIDNVSAAIYADYIPVGSVEFVTKFCEAHVSHYKRPKPLNVPEELIEYKKFTYMYPKTVINEERKYWEWYVKSNNCIKSQLNGVYTTDELKELPDYNTYQISKMQNIVAEFRCFVNHGKMLDCRCYSGDCRATPDYNLIKEMIEKYNRQDPYTLDVFVTCDLETQLMECHDFWSVGLYGFEHPSLCQMVSQGFYNLKRSLLY